MLQQYELSPQHSVVVVPTSDIVSTTSDIISAASEIFTTTIQVCWGRVNKTLFFLRQQSNFLRVVHAKKIDGFHRTLNPNSVTGT